MAPEGTYCRFHPERPALARCPRCGDFACIACWHSSVDRCNACLQRNPAEAAPPIPWEDPERGLLARFVGTLFAALRPTSTAPGFARDALGPAIAFALLTAVPLALVRGIIPFTHTLRFGPSGAISYIGNPTDLEVALDVGRAALISLGLTTAFFLTLTLPFVSLARAYGTGRFPDAALRQMLYRAFLIALSLRGPFVWLIAWLLPEETIAQMGLFIDILDMIPLVLLFISMRATARLAHGVGPFATLAVVLVPLTLLVLVYSMYPIALAPWLPAPPPGQPPIAALP